MENNDTSPPVHRIGRWTFHPDTCRLQAPHETRPLEERAARTLEILCRRRGMVVSKDELVTLIWRGRTVSPNSLAIVIGDLRRALDDDPRAPTLIQTVKKRGYRLAAPQAPIIVRPRIWTRRLAPSSAFLAAALLAIVALNARAPVALVIEPTRNETGRTEYAPLATALGSVVMDSATHLRGFRITQNSRAKRSLILRTRLILWDGAPELALTAIDHATGVVVWSGFAPGPNDRLARHSADRIRDMGATLGSRSIL
ncbi:winged helix-turn-helix domain-containing protein [Caulobacter sp. 1776]|uniref:winged helix-turn-helix domain-containing protein n=1 Tax=Caulobacter sp. 1776 TaxID=3156420 RepID=UPI0033931446